MIYVRCHGPKATGVEILFRLLVGHKTDMRLAGGDRAAKAIQGYDSLDKKAEV